MASSTRQNIGPIRVPTNSPRWSPYARAQNAAPATAMAPPHRVQYLSMLVSPRMPGAASMPGTPVMMSPMPTTPMLMSPMMMSPMPMSHIQIAPMQLTPMQTAPSQMFPMQMAPQRYGTRMNLHYPIVYAYPAPIDGPPPRYPYCPSLRHGADNTMQQ
ncbi:hypothetical protein HGRIS_010553 [Hohenbuehelia grisea]|uniref:Uncharacterized protein n=1 Tax=Hohenbuehelia grisea TaxID=104357 RepID=A0ABR3IXK3_9AGAR